MSDGVRHLLEGRRATSVSRWQIAGGRGLVDVMPDPQALERGAPAAQPTPISQPGDDPSETPVPPGAGAKKALKKSPDP